MFQYRQRLVRPNGAVRVQDLGSPWLIMNAPDRERWTRITVDAMLHQISSIQTQAVRFPYWQPTAQRGTFLMAQIETAIGIFQLDCYWKLIDRSKRSERESPVIGVLLVDTLSPYSYLRAELAPVEAVETLAYQWLARYAHPYLHQVCALPDYLIGVAQGDVLLRKAGSLEVYAAFRPEDYAPEGQS